MKLDHPKGGSHRPPEGWGLHPQTNGKIEAFCKIIKDEFFYPNRFTSERDLILNLGNFLFEFNHLRRHGGLQYMTPFDKLEKVTELLS